MTRLLISIVLFILILTIQASFIHALAYPFDRIPLMLVMSIYLYQYGHPGMYTWWLVGYGIALDALHIGTVPFEVVSYSIATIVMILTGTHIVTNKSFYAMTLIAVIVSICVGVSQVGILAFNYLFTDVPIVWGTIWNTQAWSVLFGGGMLLFVIPPLRRLLRRILHT